jgi:hypothetical protein
MNYEVYAVIQGFSDACSSGEDFETLELFFDEKDAIKRKLELEEEQLYSSDYVEMRKIEVQ